MNNEKLSIYKEKYRHIAAMKRELMTEREIAKKLGCTHQNINLILKKYFFNETFPVVKRGRKIGSSVFKLVDFQCIFCKKVKQILGSPTNLKKKFCDQICYLKYSGRNINVNVSKMTKAEYRVYNNTRMKKYYHSRKTDPKFKALISKYNKNAAIKRKLKKSN